MCRKGDNVLEAPEELMLGYSKSKWVAEQILKKAAVVSLRSCYPSCRLCRPCDALVQAGLPVSIHRPGRIVGDMSTGACALGDFMFSVMRGCVQLGAYPKYDNIFTTNDERSSNGNRREECT